MNMYLLEHIVTSITCIIYYNSWCTATCWSGFWFAKNYS